MEETQIASTVDSTTPDESTENYIRTIQELRDGSVPKDKYQRLLEENRQLLDSLVHGKTLEDDQPSEKTASADELRQRLFKNGELSNLEYCQTALQLREALIAEGKRDPFLPYGKDVLPTDDDVLAAERVAKVMQECIDYADGDPNIFTDELMRRTVDTAPSRHKR